MSLKVFEFVEQFMMKTFLFELTHYEITGSIRETLISLENLIINFHFRNLKSIMFFVTFTLFLFDSGVFPPFNNENALNLRNHREKPKMSVNK